MLQTLTDVVRRYAGLVSGAIKLALVSVLSQPFFSVAQYEPQAGSTGVQGPQGWRIYPALTLSEVFTDNVSLAPAGSARSEWTTRVRPEITATHNSARLRFLGTYSPDLLYRAQEGTSDLSHYLNMTSNAELWARKLFIDLRAGATQQNVSLLQPQASSNINVTQNRTEVRNLSVSPYLRHDFGVDANGELRFTYDSVNFGGSGTGFSSTRSERIDAKLGSGPAYKLFTWNITAGLSHLEYSRTGQKVDSQNYLASGGRLITPDIRLNASVGYDDSGYLSSNGTTLKGKSWSLGPEWTPTERTRVAVNYGRRYFGPSRSVTFTHRTSRSVWGLEYKEDTTTTLGNFSSVLSCQARFPNNLAFQQQCEQDRRDGIAGEAVNFLTNDFFLDKRLQANFGIQGVRNTLTANVFTSDRTALSVRENNTVSGDFSSSSNVRQVGTNVTWASRLSPTLSSNLSMGITRNGFSSIGRTDSLTTIRLGVTKQFHPKVSGAVTVARLKNDSTAVGQDYTENSASATLNLRY